jgi:hypothetical protein
MKTFLFAATTTTSLLLGSTLLAGPIDDIVAQFQGYGYQSIEIVQQGSTVRIEGLRDGTQREIVYDTATNTILRDETGPADDNENHSSVSPNESGDDSSESSEDDHGQGGDDDENDDQGDDENDDQGDDEGDDDDGDDDHGDDDHGDDHGGDENDD